MLDKKAISSRFFSCYPGKSRRDLAILFCVGKSAIIEWATKGTVPWSKLKFLSDSQAISWDWILEGLEPKESPKAAVIPDSTSPSFDRAGINQRFLSLFPKMTLTQIAAVLNVTSGAVSGWNRNFSQVSWERLCNAVDSFAVRWDWLIDGLEPKYRDQQK